jgi:hypothetical protein
MYDCGGGAEKDVRAVPKIEQQATNGYTYKNENKRHGQQEIKLLCASSKV